MRRAWYARAVLAVSALVLVLMPAPAQAAFDWRGDDYNWDGFSDLLTIYEDDSGLAGCMTFWAANGTGGFYYRRPVTCGFSPNLTDRTAAAGDLNNDGVGDIVAISYGDTCLYVKWGINDGIFTDIKQIGCGWDPYTQLLGPGDINSDGNEDLMAVHINGCLYKWLGNGAGGFAPVQEIGCGWESYYADNLATPGDLNRDGHPDLVTIDPRNNCMMRWYGDGRGSFGDGVLIGCGWERFLYKMVGLQDANGDGNGDLIARDSAGYVYAWYGMGNGGFWASVQLSGILLDNRKLIG
jgi:hypothetical protein